MPTRFRDGFLSSQHQLTLTRHPHGSLLVFPRERWLVVSEQMDSMPLDQQWVKRIVFGFATDVEMDKSARVLVAPELRSALQIKPNTQLMMQGMGSYLEVWDEAVYWAKEQEAQSADGFAQRQSTLLF